MLRLFGRNTGIQAIIILAVVVVLWFGALIHPEPMPEPVGFAPLYSLIYSLGMGPLVAVILSIVLAVGGGLCLNIMMVRVNLVSQNSLLPTLFYILFMGAQATTLTPTLIVGVMVIGIVNMFMLHGTLLTIASDKIFGAAALIGLCSMIYLPSAALVVTYMMVAVNYRLYGWREWMVLLLGLLAPYLLLWSYYFLTGELEESFVSMGATLSEHPQQESSVSQLSAIAAWVLATTFVVSLVVFWRTLSDKTVVWKKNATSILLVTVAGLVAMLYVGQYPPCLQNFAIPFALCATGRFGNRERRRGYRRGIEWREHLYELLFIIIIVSSVIC
jgi:hypothetical protein